MFERERESLARQGKWAWFLLVPVLCIGSYCVCGIGAAIAIPLLEDFRSSADAMEAEDHLATLASAMEAWCDREGASAGFPPSVGPIPEAPRAELQPFASAGSFVELGFAPDSVRYSYSIDSSVSGRSRVVAEGDLDGDGIRSHYVIECHVAADACDCDDRASIERELE